MIKKIKSLALENTVGTRVDIEADVSPGLPYFNIVGLADTSVKEAAERVRRAIRNSGFEYPKGRITVNLSPAYIHKKGSHFDLGIAVGILAALQVIKGDTEDKLFIGELSFDGRVRPVTGVLPMLSAIMGEEKIDEIFLAEENCREAFLLTRDSGKRLIPVRNLTEAATYIDGEKGKPYEAPPPPYHQERGWKEDFGDVGGHEEIKEAIMTAVAGGHNIMMMGPPGTGKTMMARRIAGLLPPMNVSEQIETVGIYSYAGRITEEILQGGARPFRHISSGITKASLVGGGAVPAPGEVSFAHNGVLFIDEFLELPPATLEVLRGPLEDREVRIVRRGGVSVFPADFMLVAAANPCRCGYLGDSIHSCTCTQSEIDKYRNKLSGPLADRLDICVEVSRVEHSRLTKKGGLSTAVMREKILTARALQDSRGCINAAMTDKETEAFCRLPREGEEFMEKAYAQFGMSPRRYYKILRVARTLADIGEREDINTGDIAAAFHYTRFMKGGAGT